MGFPRGLADFPSSKQMRLFSGMILTKVISSHRITLYNLKIAIKKKLLRKNVVATFFFCIYMSPDVMYRVT